MKRPIRRASSANRRLPPTNDAPSSEHLRVLEVIRSIPTGYVSTYGRIADAAGLPRRARWVGTLLRRSPLADEVPWHRVVNAQGRISLRRGDGPGEQRRRLLAEGVEIDAAGRIDLASFLYSFQERA